MTSRIQRVSLVLASLVVGVPAVAQLAPQLSSTLVPFDSLNFTLGDFDSDGAPDLVSVDSYRFDLALNTGRGAFTDFRSELSPTNANDVISGDFDGDGLADVMLFQPGVVRVRKGRGDGTFDPSGPSFPAPTASGTVHLRMTCELDADGDLDVVLASPLGPLYVLRNDGAGSFTGLYATTLGMTPVGLGFADLDGDGLNDLFVVDSASSYLYHVRALPSGSFQLTGSTFVGAARIACGDLDGDGDRDLAACAPHSLVVQYFRNDRNGLWTPSGSTNVAASYVNELRIADWDGDGGADVLVTVPSVSGAQLIWIGAPLLGGAGTQTTFLETLQSPVRLAVADFDRDGRLDVATSRAGGVEVLRGLGDGRFKAPQLDERGFRAVEVERGDYDGDGDEELAYLSSAGIVFSDLTMPTLPNLVGIESMRSADFDGDAVLDLAALSSLGVFQVNFVSAGTLAIGDTVFNARELAVGDLDGDGDVDLACTVATVTAVGDVVSEVYWTANLGGGAFGPVQTLDMGWPAQDIEIVDIDADGRLDLVTVGYSDSSAVSRVSIRRGVPGGFAPAELLANPILASALEARDLDGDGLPELAVVGAGPFKLAVHRNLGGGAFVAPPEKYDLPAEFVVGRSSPQVADLDGDGALDLAVAGRSGRVAVAFGDATGSFVRFENYSAIGSDLSSDLVPVDFDGDGDLDLVSVGGWFTHVLENGQVTRAETYCPQAPNSVGCAASIAVSGTPNASGVGTCTIDASEVVSQRTGSMFYGLRAQNLPAAAGALCVASPLRRTPAQNSGGNSGALDCSGTFSFDFNARIASGVDPALVAGQIVFAQYYFRDPVAASGASFSSAAELRIAP